MANMKAFHLELNIRCIYENVPYDMENETAYMNFRLAVWYHNHIFIFLKTSIWLGTEEYYFIVN